MVFIFVTKQIISSATAISFSLIRSRTHMHTLFVVHVSSDYPLFPPFGCISIVRIFRQFVSHCLSPLNALVYYVCHRAYNDSTQGSLSFCLSYFLCSSSPPWLYFCLVICSLFLCVNGADFISQANMDANEVVSFIYIQYSHIVNQMHTQQSRGNEVN